MLLATIGLCNILLNSTLLDFIRARSIFAEELLSCPMCSGWWASVIVIGLMQIHQLLVLPFIGSLICSLLVRQYGR
jgi:hypothetical protein